MNSESFNKEFNTANKVIHPVQTQWHYPIMTKYGYVAITKEDVGFVRRYIYQHPVTGHKMSAHTGANGDYFCDDHHPIDWKKNSLKLHLKSFIDLGTEDSVKSLMKLGYSVKYHSLTRSYEPTYKDNPIGNSTHSSVENGWKYIQDYFLKLSKEDQEKMINHFNK